MGLFLKDYMTVTYQVYPFTRHYHPTGNFSSTLWLYPTLSLQDFGSIPVSSPLLCLRIQTRLGGLWLFGATPMLPTTSLENTYSSESSVRLQTFDCVLGSVLVAVQFFFENTSFFSIFFSDSLYFMVTGVLVSSNNQLRKQWHMSRIGWISISLRCHVGRFFRVSERGRSGCHAGQGCSIFVFNYSGFGRSDGHPSPGQWLIWKISYVFQRAPFNSNANVQAA